MRQSAPHQLPVSSDGPLHSLGRPLGAVVESVASVRLLHRQCRCRRVTGRLYAVESRHQPIGRKALAAMAAAACGAGVGAYCGGAGLPVLMSTQPSCETLRHMSGCQCNVAEDEHCPRHLADVALMWPGEQFELCLLCSHGRGTRRDQTGSTCRPLGPTISQTTPRPPGSTRCCAGIGMVLQHSEGAACNSL